MLSKTSITFVVLILLAIPIAFVLGMVPAAYFLFDIGKIPSIIFPQKMIGGTTSFVLMAIPFFILAGNLMNEGGVTKRLIDFCQAIVGNLRGGLGIVNIVASMMFGGISGSSNADVAAFGTALIPQMVEEGYDIEYSTAITVTSSTVGPIIPPSITMVVYGSLANVSIGALFLGGIIPGILIGLFLTILTVIVAKRKNYPKSGVFSLHEVWRTFKRAILALGMPIIIMGGVLGGIATPTEAAAIAVVYSFVVGYFIFRSFKLKDLYRIIIDTAILSGAIFLVIAFTNVLAYVVASARIPQVIGAFLLSVTKSKYVFLLIVNIILLIIGMFMDPSAGLILLTPILVPIAKTMGIDLVHLGLVMTLNLTIGLTTPPVGTALYIGSTLSGLSVQRLFKAMLPYLLSNIAVLMLITYIPSLVTWMAGLI